jgi:3-phosphoshikimate 1-carboxyvinyltransferase
VDCQEFSHGLHIWKSGKPSDNLRFNLRDFPDLLPALAITCAGLGLAAVFTGLENLVIKESNRSKAIQQELLKIGINSSMPSNGELILFSSNLGDTLKETCISFESYNDHRIAMALAPLVMKLGEIEINQSETVSKSYPGYWNELFKTNAVSID